MSFEKQVDRTHYTFGRYYDPKRWASVWHQIDEVTRYSPQRVLEVGGGLGVFKQTMQCFGVEVTVVDIADDLQPDLIGSVTDLPVADASYDVACAFQVLEHIPFDRFETALKELKRVARRAVVISVPDAQPVYSFSVVLPWIGRRRFLLRKPFVKLAPKPECEEHCWEVHRPGCPPEAIKAVFERLGFGPVRCFRVFDKPYHRFYSAPCGHVAE